MTNQAVVFRNFALPVPAFDHLKDVQRGYEKQHGVKINNNQTLAIILRQHQKMLEEFDGNGWLDD